MVLYNPTLNILKDQPQFLGVKKVLAKFVSHFLKSLGSQLDLDFSLDEWEEDQG